MSELPPGFVLDQQQAAPDLPPGFVLDKPGMLEDAAKSTASGLASMTASTLGMAGDLRSGLSAATDWAGGKLGASPDKVQAFKDLAGKAASMTGSGYVFANAPTSRQIINSAPDPIVSPDYQPQYPTGKALKTGAEFLPAMIGGPESVGAKLLTRVAVPAVGSEIGKEVGGPLGGVAGALISGAGASKAVNAFNEARALKAATPALDTLKPATSAGYDALTAGNVSTPLAANTLENVANDIRDTLNRKGIRPTNAGSIHSSVEELKLPANAGAPDVADLVASRQSIKDLLGKHDTNKAGAFVALQKIESAIETASPGTMQKLKELDKNWGAVRATESLDKRVAKAELTAAGEHSGFNVGNKIRQQVKNLLTGSEAKYLSAETKAELEKIVRGTWTSNGIRMVSKLFGAGGGLGMLAGGAAGYHEGGIPGAVAAGVAGRSLGRLDATLTAMRAKKAAEAIRRASPAGQQMPLALPPQTSMALSGLLPALLARPQQ